MIQFPYSFGQAPLSAPSFVGWGLEGSIGEESFLWSTFDGPGVESVLLEPPTPFYLGVSGGAAPLRPSTEVKLKNEGRRLTRFFTGQSTESPADEYLEPSFYDLKARVVRLLAREGGVIAIPFSPLMEAVGVMQSSTGVISLSLATPEERSGVGGITVGELLELPLSVEYVSPALKALWGWLSDAQILQRVREQLTDPNIVIPLAIGSGVTEAEVAGSGADTIYAGYLSDEVLQGFVFLGDKLSPALTNGRLVLEADGQLHTLFVFPGVKVEERATIEFFSDDSMEDVLAKIAAFGGLELDARSLEREEDEIGIGDGLFGGALRTETTVPELLEHLLPALSLRAYYTRDGELGFIGGPYVAAPAFTIEPHDDYPSDGLPSIVEEVSADSDDITSPLRRVSVTYGGWLEKFYPRASRSVEVSEIGSELTLSSSWLRPSQAQRALTRQAASRAFPVRIFHVATHIDYAEHLGELGELSSRFGVEELAGRLVRIVGVEVRPAHEAAILTLEDCEPLRAARQGLYDLRANWTKFSTEVHQLGLTMQGGVAIAVIGSGSAGSAPMLFTAADVGSHLWVELDGVVESYTILDLYESGSVDPGVGVIIDRAPSPARLAFRWRLMHSYDQRGFLENRDRVAGFPFEGDEHLVPGSSAPFRWGL